MNMYVERKLLHTWVRVERTLMFFCANTMPRMCTVAHVYVIHITLKRGRVWNQTLYVVVQRASTSQANRACNFIHSNNDMLRQGSNLT